MSAFSQVEVSYFPFQSLLSLSTDTEKRVFADYKIETNTFLSNLNMEISPMVNVRRKERVNGYLGAGISFNPFNGYSDLPILNGYFAAFGVRIKPLKTLKSVHLIFELSPYFNKEWTGGNLRSRLGVGWNFRKEK
jgi:hypothetical protein